MDEPLNNPTDETVEQPVLPATQEAETQPTPVGTDGGESVKEETFFDPKDLSPELLAVYKNMQGAYTKKTQEIADFKKKGEVLDQLGSYEPFVKWYNQHRAGLDKGLPDKTLVDKTEQEQPKGSMAEMTQEELMEIQGNPKKFQEYVKNLALQASAPMVREAQQKAEYVMNLNKVENFAREHPDFWDLDKKGLVEPLIEKYPGMELEDVYKLAKFPFVEDEAVRKAHNIVQDKKVAVTEKPGQVMAGSSKVKVKSREEAMSLAWDFAQKGQAIPEFDYSK